MQLEKICRVNYARIYNYALARTGKKEAAEDITQNVFLIACQKGEAFLCHEKPVAFLYATARNLVLEYYKAARSEEVELDETKMTVYGRDAYEELCVQKSDSVNECCYQDQVVRKLQPEEQELYRKYYIDKRSMRSIARELEISEPAVRMKYMRIRRKIRKIVAGFKLDEF